MALDTLEFEERSAGPCFFMRGPTQIIFEPRVTSQDKRQTPATPTRLFNELFDTAQRLPMQVMSIIN